MTFKKVTDELVKQRNLDRNSFLTGAIAGIEAVRTIINESVSIEDTIHSIVKLTTEIMEDWRDIK